MASENKRKYNFIKTNSIKRQKLNCDKHKQEYDHKQKEKEMILEQEDDHKQKENVRQYDNLTTGFVEDNPWDILTIAEKKLINEFIDFMIPIPRIMHLENTTEICKFVYMKQTQMNSLRAIYKYWNFSTVLCTKIEKIFCTIDNKVKLFDQLSNEYKQNIMNFK